MRRVSTPLELLFGMPSEAAYKTEDAYVSVASKHMHQTYGMVRDQLHASYDRTNKDMIEE